jgi:hypothetical protein
MLPGDGRTYDLPVSKGHYQSIPLVAWAAIENCMPTLCHIEHLCSYQKTDGRKMRKCGLQKNYIQNVSSMIHRCFHKELGASESLLFRVGMHLMPLYKTLCKLKMEELSVHSPVTTTLRGDRKVDPVYKEIRETIKIVMMCWKDLGLDGSLLSGAGNVLRGVSRGYEDELFEEEPEENVTKPKLKVFGGGDDDSSEGESIG